MTFQMTKGQTQFMKGIAILMMLMHHLIFSSDAIKIGSFDIPENIAHLFYNFGRICVPVFAFLSGWGLSLKKTIDGKYCLKKILLLLTIYEIVYIPLLLFSLGGGV